MKCARMSAEKQWKNMGRNAAKLKISLEKVCTGNHIVDGYIEQGFKAGCKKYGFDDGLRQLNTLNIRSPLIPGITSWIAWHPIGSPNWKRWFSCISQAWKENKTEGWESSHFDRAHELWKRGLTGEGLTAVYNAIDAENWLEAHLG